MGIWDVMEKAKEAEKAFAAIDMSAVGPMLQELPGKLQEWSEFLAGLRASQVRIEAATAQILEYVRPRGDLTLEMTQTMAAQAADDPRNKPPFVNEDGSPRVIPGDPVATQFLARGVMLGD